jgi:hypothetical protein
MPREHLIDHTAHGIQIAAPVQLLARRRRLRAHVGRRAEREPGFSQPVLACGADGERDPEVGDDGLLSFQKDVLRLDVAVDDAMRVGPAQSAQYLGSEAKSFIERELPFPQQSLPE